MAKTQANVKEGYSANARVYAAKQERRIEKANYPLAQKIAVTTKLRNTASSLRSAKLVQKGKIVKA
ncbi:MAG: hypothetical protein ACKVQW_14785 [Pyrinomonadaceae bacterium]